MTVGTLTLGTENIVTTTDLYKPLTGVFSTEDINGWVWDRRTTEDWDELRTRYNTFVGGHSVGLKDATKLTDWQSGVVSNLQYHDIAHYRVGDHLTWTPRVITGAYALYFDKRNLYSDYSFSQNIDVNQNQNGLNIVALRDDAFIETIQVAIWSRTSDYQIFKAFDFDYVDTFTGEIDTVTNTRLSTEDADGNFLTANFASRKREFTIRDRTLYLNGNHQYDVAKNSPALNLATVPAATITGLWENKGDGSGSGRNLFTDYFPLQRDSVQVVSESNGTLTEWTEVATLDFSGPTDRHFVVDSDLGIITIGGYKAPDLFLAENLDVEDVEVVTYIDEESMAEYPEKGILLIGSEQILYLGKTKNTFIDCVRGYNSTTAATYGVGTRVSDRQHGLGSTDTFFVSYTAIPRVDYEVTEHIKRSANKGSWLDVRPVRNVVTNNILQIQSSTLHLDSIVLETDSALIGANLYGPVYYGTDVSRLTARALDSQGNPVDGIPLTIELIEGVGALNGIGTTRTANTNSLGEIYAFYNAPYSNSSSELIVSKTEYVGTDTVMTIKDLETGTNADDVWVFQILKHDKIIGTTGLQRSVTAQTTLVPPYGNQGLTIDGLLQAEDYKGGFIYLLGSNGIKYFRNIVNVQETVDGSSRPVSQIGIDAAIPAGVVVGQPIWLYEAEAKQWNSALLNGIRQILYEYSTLAQHPITGAAGAYAPLHPDSTTSTTITFNNRLLPIPAPADDTNNLGGYAVIAPSEVSLQAYGKDPASGRVVKSNIIRLALRLPNFLTGVDTSGVLPIPYGWTFVTEEFNIGAGLGGANFVTINPAADGINQFSIAGVFP